MSAEPQYKEVATDLQQEVSQSSKLMKLVGILAVVGAIASLAALCIPKGGGHSLDMGEVDIEITKQKGVTANVDAGVKFGNDMSNILHDNNGAFSEEGAVARINGAYDNNAVSKGGDVERANGWYGNNAISKNGDVTTEGDVQSKNSGVQSSTDGTIGLSSAEEVAGGSDSPLLRSLRTGELPSGQDGDSVRRGLIEIAKNRDLQQSSGGSYSLKDLAADYYHKRQADAEQENHVLLKVLMLLYGQNSTSIDSSDTLQAGMISQFQQEMLNQSIAAAKMNQDTIHQTISMIGKNGSKLLNRSGITVTNSTRPNQNAEMAKLISDDLEKVTNQVQGPVKIGKLKVKVKDQAGIQANLGAGVEFKNYMPNSLYNNNNAKSAHGDVMRFNGAYDNNAIGQGHVLRVNGAYDNNAISKGDGTVTRTGAEKVA